MSKLIITTVEQCAPNRWPIRIIRVQTDITSPVIYMIEETDPEGYWEYTDEGLSVLEFSSLDEAKKAYNERVRELSNEPNWDAQDEYDREHDTINGYAPWQYNGEY